MLNKNQSKKWNSWKYVVIAPALVAFVLLFQIEVIAQEKKQVTQETTLNSVTTELEINSTSTKEELNAEKDFFKEEFGIQVTFTDLEYNDNNEITQIKVVLKSSNNEIKIYSVKETTPIKPFKIFAKTENDKKVIFGFMADKKKNSHLSNHFKATEKNAEKIEVEVKDSDSETKKSNDDDYFSINNFEKDGVKYLLVINGVIQSKNQPIRLSINDEIVSERTLEPKEAIAKYGTDAANGAHEITTSSLKIENKKNEKRKAKEIKVVSEEIQYIIDEEQAKKDAIQAKIDNEQAKKDAVQARKDAMQAKIDSEQAKKDAMQARKDAIQARKDATRDNLNKQ